MAGWEDNKIEVRPKPIEFVEDDERRLWELYLVFLTRDQAYQFSLMGAKEALEVWKNR